MNLKKKYFVMDHYNSLKKQLKQAYQLNFHNNETLVKSADLICDQHKKMNVFSKAVNTIDTTNSYMPTLETTITNLYGEQEIIKTTYN